MRIPRSEYARRRKDLMAFMEPNSIAIIAAAPEVRRSRDTDYHYRQDSDFYYLSGFTEPSSVLVLIPGREHGEFVMFVRERKREEEIWTGFRQGPEGVCENYGADDAFPIDDIDDILPGLIEGKQRVYYAMGKDLEFDKQVMNWVNTIRAKVRSGATPPGEFMDLNLYLHEQRLIKSAAEIRVMREAGEISAKAHVRAMKKARPGLYEYQLEAEILHEFGMHGARFASYNTIVGGGANGCILHYIDNSAPLKDGDLVLIDAGCELEYYAGDITRTFPVNGKFSAAQKVLYEVCLAAQLAAIDAAKPGNHWNDPHDVTVKVITQGLIDLGLIKGTLEAAIESGAYRDFYMHRAGHWLGMDVHDVGDYKVGGEWRILEPGMVLTIEPGIYVSPDNLNVDAEWRGIGIRIEDDVVITKDGNEILTQSVPKTVAEIEALMAQARE